MVDLGSGAGVPALALAQRWQAARLLLVESQHRKVVFLGRAVRALQLTSRVTVLAERAELAGRSAAWRGKFDLATARGFGPPGVVAECAAPFLAVGGRLVVSEPPAADAPVADQRWPAEGLIRLGLGPPEPTGSIYRFVLVVQEQPCPERYPRRVGVPAKRPLF